MLMVAQPIDAKPVAVGQWKLVETRLGPGMAICMLQEHADRFTTIQFMAAARHHGVFGVSADNPNWSIKEGDDIGEISFTSGKVSFADKPKTVLQGFYYSVREKDVVDFAKSAGPELELRRDGEQIGRYPVGNLRSAIDLLVGCGAKLYARDPFAQPAGERAPNSQPNTSQAAELAAIPIENRAGRGLGGQSCRRNKPAEEHGRQQ